jgi:hypothetical protein
MLGKQYLVDLSAAGLPVIPTVDRREDLTPPAGRPVRREAEGRGRLGGPAGAGPRSAGRAVVDRQLVQPHLELRYEVSFYFIDRDFQYASTPPTREAVGVERYEPDDEDLAFAPAVRRVETPSTRHPARRCRPHSDGELLLGRAGGPQSVLSLDLVEEPTRSALHRPVRRLRHPAPHDHLTVSHSRSVRDRPVPDRPVLGNRFLGDRSMGGCPQGRAVLTNRGQGDRGSTPGERFPAGGGRWIGVRWLRGRAGRLRAVEVPPG